jgi:hypothetical protein
VKIGILSDTHGNAQATKAAICLVMSEGAEHVVHCGDLADVGQSCLPILQLLPHGRASFVFGNTDTDTGAARVFAAEHPLTAACLSYEAPILAIWPRPTQQTDQRAKPSPALPNARRVKIGPVKTLLRSTVLHFVTLAHHWRCAIDRSAVTAMHDRGARASGSLAGRPRRR